MFREVPLTHISSFVSIRQPASAQGQGPAHHRGGAEPPTDRPPGRHGQIPTTATPTAPQKPTARPLAQGGTGGGPCRATSQGGPQRRKRGRLPRLPTSSDASWPPLPPSPRLPVPTRPGGEQEPGAQERTHDHHPPPQPTGSPKQGGPPCASHHAPPRDGGRTSPPQSAAGAQQHAPPDPRGAAVRRQPSPSPRSNPPNLHGPPHKFTQTPVGQTHSHRGMVDPGPPTHTDHQTSPAPQMHSPQHHRPTREDTVTNPP
ncbi:proline-rich protein 2-like [Solea solea]|uniref:proline-rich protein 2-like n=1 Tax=Solea solea TaxID=90069 RepID=UPI00272BCD92|nr:proline-rich protein 2-like [Solea solea]